MEATSNKSNSSNFREFHLRLFEDQVRPKNPKMINESTENCLNLINLVDPKSIYSRVPKIVSDKLRLLSYSDKLDLVSRIGISYSTLNRMATKGDYWANVSTLIQVCGSISIEESESLNKIGDIKAKNSVPVSVKSVPYSPQLMRILGHLIGDGGIHIRKKDNIYRPFYVNNCKVLLDSFASDIFHLFQFNDLYFRNRKDHGDEIWLPTTLGLFFYKILEYERNNHSKRVPSFVFDQSTKCKSSFLQALYDDEGFIYPEKRMIVISLSSRNLVEDIQKLVETLDISANPVRIHNAKNRTTMYYFSITHKSNILKFNELIQFKHPEKLRKLNKLVGKYQ